MFLVVGLTTFVGAFSTAGEFASNDDDVVDERMLVQNHVSSFNTAYIMGCAMVRFDQPIARDLASHSYPALPPVAPPGHPS